MKYFEKVMLKKKSMAWVWLVPFMGFLLGYIITTFSVQKQEVCVPNVVGKDLATSIVMLSRSHLGARVLKQHEDDLLPHGTVIEQLPRPMQKTRLNQNVFLTISVKKQAENMPDMWSKRKDEAVETVAKRGLDVQEVVLQTPYPRDMCIAQIPNSQATIQTKKAILYFSAGRSGLSIMPNLKGMRLNEVIDAFKLHDIRAEIFHDHPIDADHSCASCDVVDHQPAPGAIVDLNKSIQVQFKVATVGNVVDV